MKHLIIFLGFVAPALPLQAADPNFYLRDIKPVLKERCYACHGALKQMGKLRLDTAALLRKGGRHGPAAEPGNAAASLLVERVREPEESRRMPPLGKPLSSEQIARIRTWIDHGAVAPAGEEPEADPRRHWAFVRPARPAVPRPSDPAWSSNPIDAFLAAEHAHRGLTASAATDRALLLRRVTLDLIGLPPSRAELHAFLNDPSPDAYTRVVDRLLASPQYGERWGRHWMDVWRYSDWYGRRAVPDVMNSYAQIWRWRDWIVRSLNEDKGYDRMILEMLAADENAPEDDANLVATGFLVRNWFKWNYNQWMRDNVEHTGKAFLGLTLNCCHCHDHKYDPITQEEYFRFRAFFEPLELRHERWPGEPDPGPFQKYVYGAANGPIRSGMIRVFDEKLEAQTYMYSGGDERNRIANRAPVAPGVPAALGGDHLKIEPIKLPPTVSNPGLKSFAVREERARRGAALSAAQHELAAARLALPRGSAVPQIKQLRLRALEAREQAARAERESLDARVLADEARSGIISGPAEFLAKAASQAERRARLLATKAALAVQEQNALDAQARASTDPGRSTAISMATAQVKAARATVSQADQSLKQESNTYTSLGPTYPRLSTGRRKALAEWIASKDNPLTARVAVNHMWARHFGRPLVETSFNFGRSGKRPSHPELLDWLAVELMENGWRMKDLHRLIVTSNAYQMRSHVTHLDDRNLRIDADNHLLWRFPPRRMEAEVVRDSILAAAGTLEPQIGGPEIPQEQGLTSHRRSLYFAHHGETRMEFLELFDEANPCECYQRTSSVLPQQALALSNSELIGREGRLLARTLWSEVAPRPDASRAFVEAAFEQILGRVPAPAEVRAVSEFLARQVALFRSTKLAALGNDGPSVQPAMRARENLVIALFNHNDFIAIR